MYFAWNYLKIGPSLDEMILVQKGSGLDLRFALSMEEWESKVLGVDPLYC